MDSYVVFTRLTPSGRKRIHDDPERILAIRREIERMGVHIKQQFATMGEYDFVTVIDAPSNEHVARVGAELAALGTMKLTTFPAVRIERFQRLLRLEPYRTEPHRWQTALWARVVRKAGRYWTTTRYVKRYCRPLTVDGQVQLKGFNGPAIIIANHSSHFDSPVVYSVLPGHVRDRLMMAAAADKFYASRKKRIWWPSLFQGAFPVHRGGGTKQLEYPLWLLKRGYSILIYPEGGRSRTGQIGRFKAGPAIMAMAANVPVIPIYMEGLRKVMPKGQREPRPAAVSVRIGKPVYIPAGSTVPEAVSMLENALREVAGQPLHVHAPKLPPAAEPEMAAASAGGR